MTRIKKTAERVMPANKGTTMPGRALQTEGKPDSTTVVSNAKKTGASKAGKDGAKLPEVAGAKSAGAGASSATEAAPVKPKTTKQEQVLTMLSQAGGATIDEIMKSTGWQQHSVRGFFAGTVSKKLGFELTSAKKEGGERRYAIKVAA
jgi:Protein of unknown function (DUF3489)